MPELPEVETIRRGLTRFLKGKKLGRVEVLCEKSFWGDSSEIEGVVVKEVRRKGKALLVDFENEMTAMVHLRMTGQMIWRSLYDPDLESENNFAAGHPSENFEAELPNKQTRVVLEFEDGKLFFNDQRKFGFIKVMPIDEVVNDDFIATLGPEPWEMSDADFGRMLGKHKQAPVKAVLLDQKNIAGLGNIYADESCYYAGVRPDRKAGAVTEKEARLLLEGARKVMETSIDSGGSTMATYRKADGTRGDYLEKFAKVFRREGKKCERCGGEIVKTRVAGRGTHYCPGCQK